jgi:hypothetical protein
VAIGTSNDTGLTHHYTGVAGAAFLEWSGH